MIYTVTFSPALDYIVELDDLKIGEINRSKKETFMPGGKGINVSIVLSNLNMESTATGFLGGFTGKYIEEELKKKNIITDFVRLENNSRINVKINGNVETAINAQGPNISDDKIQELINKLSVLNENDYLIISGTIPSSLPSNTYQRILDLLSSKKINLIIDSNKDYLLNTLKYHPFLIKPNKEELEEMLNTKINSIDELTNCALKLIDRGSQNVIVSLGKDGAILVRKNQKPIHIKAPKGKMINSVGAGDSLVAGFVYQYVKTNDIVDAFMFSIATGSASAFSTQLANKDDVINLYNIIKKDR